MKVVAKGEDVFETAKKQPGEMEVTSGKTPASQQNRIVPEQEKKIEEMKIADEVKSRQLAAKIVGELEAEIKRLQQIRKEQLRQRRQAPEPKVTPAEPQPLQGPPPKKRRGILGGFWSKRIRSAQQQAQPEMAGRRVRG